MNRRIPHYRDNKFKRRDYLLLIKYFVFFIFIFILTVVVIWIFINAIRIKQKYDVVKPVNLAIIFKDQIKILRYDPKYKEVLLLKINGDTVFNTSRLGEYPAKSLYDLSLNERMGSELLRITLMKNLHLPIYEVIDCRNEMGSDSLPALTILKCNNSRFADRIYISYVLSRVGGNKIFKELEDYKVLEPDPILGGFRINDNVFSKLEFDFSADSSIKDIISVEIEVPEGSYVPKYFDDIIRISGGRVVRTSNVNLIDISADCVIKSNNKDYIKYMKTIFRCAGNYTPEAKESVYIFSKGYLESF